MRFLTFPYIIVFISLCTTISSWAQMKEPEFVGGKTMLDTYLNLKIPLPDSINDDYPLSFDLKISKDGKAFDLKTTETLFRNQLETAIAQMPLWDVSGVEINDEGFSLSIKTVLSPTIYSKVDEQAQFPSGTADLYRFIASNIKMPQSVSKKGFNHKVYVRFVVNKEGKVEQPEILKSAGENFDNEVLRILSIMPNWLPAKIGSKNVSSFFVLPITFRAQ